MKYLFFVSILGILFLSSCQEDSLTETEDFDFASQEKEHLAEFKAYKEQQDVLVVEHMSLTELNALYAVSGIAALSESDFTSEEWEQLQSTELQAKQRCSSGLAVYYGDWNGNGSLSGVDLVLSQNFFNNVGELNFANYSGTIINPSDVFEARLFARFSHRYPNDPNANTDPDWLGYFWYDQGDIEVAQRVVLGINPC